MNKRAFLATIIIIVFGAASMIFAGGKDLKKITLGRMLYFDTNLSTPVGQACASCHSPAAGWAEPDAELPVSEGVIAGRFGNRNSPTAAYAAFSPVFHYDAAEGLYIGGQFWDGRAATLADQAKGPFLNALEMNNPDKEAVVDKVEASDYAVLFEIVYGPGAFDDVETAYDNIADAIARFESTRELNQFTSKYDYYLKGLAELTAQEASGLALFNDPVKGNCAACHPSAGEKALFTDFSYDNLGVPKNPDNPFYSLPPEFNPDGEDWIDLGLGGVLGLAEEMGKVKVPTLRNIAETAPYTHNGFFVTLGEIVHFYNTAGDGTWPEPEVADNVNRDELGALGLNTGEEEAIVAFLHTLTDGYSLGKNIAASPSLAAGKTYELAQNYPNPFNPQTSIRFSLPQAEMVTLAVYDVTGQKVKTLAEQLYQAGPQEILWDGTDADNRLVASGIYVYRIEAGSFVQTKSMVFLK